MSLPAFALASPLILALAPAQTTGHRVLAPLERWIAETDLTALALQCAAALIVALLVHLALSTVLRIAARRLSKAGTPDAAAFPTASPLDRSRAILRTLGGLMLRTSGLFILIASISAGSVLLPLPPKAQTLVHTVFIIAFVVQATIWASAALNLWIAGLDTSGAAERHMLSSATGIIGALARGALWAVALLLILDNLGFNITTLVAGLGIGGIAIGLAAQKILGDLFASLAILLDKPFEYGDFIVAGSQMGTVERIGLKTTRLRSLSGEQIIVANADLLESRIQNFKRMAERRVVFSLGVIYGTTFEQLQFIPEVIETAVKRQSNVRFDRSHFMAYGDSSLNFETVYYVLSADYTSYMNTHQAILLEIYRQFAENGIEFAFPTRTVHIGSMPARSISADETGASPE